MVAIVVLGFPVPDPAPAPPRRFWPMRVAQAFLCFTPVLFGLTAGSPALADIMELSCTADSFINPVDGGSHPFALDLHVSVDLVQHTVRESTGADNGERPNPASISDTFIRWDESGKVEGWAYKY